MDVGSRSWGMEDWGIGKGAMVKRLLDIGIEHSADGDWEIQFAIGKFL